jgi:hypothetical protein
MRRTLRVCDVGRMRRLVVVVSMIAVIAAAMSAAAAGNVAATWSTTAQRAAFPVYRPLQTLGLRFDGVRLARYTGCLTAGWGNPQSYAGPHFGIDEPGDTSRCGQPGVATPVATATINGVKVKVLVQCPAWPKCTVKDGETDGVLLLFVPERAGKHYAIQLDSRHISVAHFLEIAKSFTSVRTGRRGTTPVHLSDFLSPDRKIWCLLNDSPGVREAACFYDANRFTGGQEYSAYLRPNGQLDTCAWQPTQSGLEACVQNWDPSAPVLKSGQVDVIYQYRCQATPTAITCMVDTGKGKGKGFTITDTGATPIP